MRSQRQNLIDQLLVLVRDRWLIAVEGDDLLLEQPRELVGLVPDPAQDLLVLRRRCEEELIRGGMRSDSLGCVERQQVHEERVLAADLPGPCLWPDEVELLRDVHRQDAPKVPGLGLELAVLDGALLERPDARDSVVRLPEHALPQQSDSDKQQRRANERDQQLRSNLCRQARDNADERITDRSPPLLSDPRLLLPSQGLRERSSRRPCS